MEQEKLYEAGCAALEKSDFSQAKELLLQAYQAKKTFKVNYLLFTALKELRDHQMASLLAEDYLLDYLRDDQKLTEYVTEMIYAGKVRKIEMTLNLMSGFMSAKEKDNFMRLFDQTLATVRTQTDVNTLTKKLKHLGALDILEQRQVFEASVSLTIAEFVESVSADLVDEDVHPLVRAAILDELRYLGSEKTVTYLLFTGEKQDFVPGDLKELDDYMMYQRLVALLEADLEYAADQKTQILAELKLKLQLLYPKLTAPFTDPEKLYAVLLGKSDLEAQAREFAQALESSLAQWMV